VLPYKAFSNLDKPRTPEYFDGSLKCEMESPVRLQ
jgi:hypothetical protein